MLGVCKKDGRSIMGWESILAAAEWPENEWAIIKSITLGDFRQAPRQRETDALSWYTFGIHCWRINKSEVKTSHFKQALLNLPAQTKLSVLLASDREDLMVMQLWLSSIPRGPPLLK